MGVYLPPVVILLWCHQQKTEACTSIGCSANFLLGVWNFSLYKLSDVLEKRFCHHSLYFVIFFCHQAIWHVYTAYFTHNQIFHFVEAGAHFSVLTTTTRSGAQVSNWASSRVLSVVATAVGEWLCRECFRFSLHKRNRRSFLLESFRHKTGVKFKPSGQLLGCFTLRLSFEAVQRSSFPHFYLSVILPLPAFLLTFLPPYYSSKPSRRCWRDIQASKDAKLRLSCRTHPRSKLLVQSRWIPLPHIINHGFFPNLSRPTASSMYVAVIMKVFPFW